ncbi:hypothetical protein [Cryptosporangium japonicum]|uniref:Uncharacterized protein n=1 Tax=Cryptosporangium japonicum TaxID=80872 RepID=A0ABN0UT41_9ACTN
MDRTELLTVTHGPVFVDSTGRRARRLRILAVALCLAFVVSLGVLASGLFGTSVDLSTAMPTPTASATASASTTAG